MTTFEKINKYRVFPRLFLIFFGIFMFEVSRWYMSLDAPTAEQTAFSSSVILAIIPIFKFYFGHKNP
jgi:hypothetical protein